ncbi:MAG: hypothetical protein ACO1O4_16095 [Devosia sp.]
MLGYRWRPWLQALSDRKLLVVVDPVQPCCAFMTGRLRNLRRVGHFFQMISGVVMILIGMAMIKGWPLLHSGCSTVSSVRSNRLALLARKD